MKIKNRLKWSFALLFCTGLYGAGWYHGHYYDFVWPFKDGLPKESELGSHSGDAQDHAGHDHGDDHGHAAPASGDFLELSETAKKNLGLSEDFLKPISLQSFQQTISVPAIVVDRPGRTRLPISATMTGIVTHIHAVSGEAVEPGDLILEMRLTHEELVTAQKDYLRSLGDRDIELKEIARIENAANSGVISNKALLDRQYSLDKLDSLLRSQRESLRLHGLTDLQITKIETDRRLLAEMKVFAPGPDEHSDDESGTSKRQPEGRHPDGRHPDWKKHTLVLQDIGVQKGQSVNAGEVLCTLADYEVLLIEGQAFESEAGLIAKAKIARWPLSATVGAADEIKRIEGLSLSWLNNEIDPATRTFKFYVTLANDLIDDNRNNSGQRHVAWKYRVGQRMQLGVPVAEWLDQIVLPVDAVIRDGIESFVFQQNGDRFERISVHERHRDQYHVVVENDGAIFPGDVVVLRGAHQMQMALKSKTGGGVDPHAGHNH